MPEEAGQDAGMEGLNNILGGGEADAGAGGSPPAEAAAPEPTAAPKPSAEDVPSEGFVEPEGTATPEPEDKSAEAPVEESPVAELDLPEGIETPAEFMREFERLRARTDVYERMAKGQPAAEPAAAPAAAERKAGRHQSMSKDEFISAMETNPFDTVAGTTVEVLRGTPEGRKLLFDVVDLAKQEMA